MNWLTIKKTAILLGISEKTLYAMAKQGRISYTRIGAKYLFREDEIKQYIAEHTHTAKKAKPALMAA